MKKLLFVLCLSLVFGCSSDDTETVTEEVFICPEPESRTIKYTALCQDCTSFKVYYIDGNGIKQETTVNGSYWELDVDLLEGDNAVLFAQTTSFTNLLSVNVYETTLNQGNGQVMDQSSCENLSDNDICYIAAIVP